MVEQCEDKRERMIPRTLDELEAELDSLTKLVEALGGRLESVMAQIPEPETNSPKNFPELIGECRMASQLIHFTRQITSLHQIVTGYIDRLEI